MFWREIDKPAWFPSPSRGREGMLFCHRSLGQGVYIILGGLLKNSHWIKKADLTKPHFLSLSLSQKFIKTPNKEHFFFLFTIVFRRGTKVFFYCGRASKKFLPRLSRYKQNCLDGYDAGKNICRGCRSANIFFLPWCSTQQILAAVPRPQFYCW